jgi:prolipoprotein diacylglyceryltransferase
MNDLLFLLGLALVLGRLLAWGFKHLPGERWQMMAVVPTKKGSESQWAGTNLTYYGFFIASSQLIALALLLVLLGAMQVHLGGTTLAIVLLLTCCLPAARLLAMLVEKKRHTFTIGGASFVGIVVAPFAVLLSGEILGVSDQLPLLPVLAAMAIAYTLGEGLGRLACISFGCCYGKPVRECNRMVRLLFSRYGFTFSGATKKVAYEGHLAGERLVPIQAITAVLYTGGALGGAYFFLQGLFTPALIGCLVLTQLWRIFSETLRADFRGFGRVSAYQKMGIAAVLYALVMLNFAAPPPVGNPEVAEGLRVLWNPLVILGLQLLWLVYFLIFGRSSVTTATVSFAVVEKNL